MAMGTGNFKIKAVAGSAQWGKSGNGTEQVAVVVACVGGDGGDANRHFTWYGFLNTEDNTKRTLESLSHLGWDGNVRRMLDVDGLGSKEAVGMFDENVYEGKTTLRCSFVNSAEGRVAMKHQLEGAERTAFADRLAAAALSLGYKPGTAKAPDSKPAAAAAPAEGRKAGF